MNVLKTMVAVIVCFMICWSVADIANFLRHAGVRTFTAVTCIGAEDGGREGTCLPPKKKNSGKYFSGNYCVKLGHFFGLKSCKIPEFC